MSIELDAACPGCDHEFLVPDLAATDPLACPCGWSAPRHPGTFDGDRPVRCPLCGDPRLFVQKDFSRRLGIGLLVVGFLLAVLLAVLVGPEWFFGTLVASAGLDALLYLIAGNVVLCHWCEAHLRGGPEDYPEFDLEEHDRVRYQKEVAATGRPVPEHEGRAGETEGMSHPREFDDA